MSMVNFLAKKIYLNFHKKFLNCGLKFINLISICNFLLIKKYQDTNDTRMIAKPKDDQHKLILISKHYT